MGYESLKIDIIRETAIVKLYMKPIINHQKYFHDTFFWVFLQYSWMPI